MTSLRSAPLASLPAALLVLALATPAAAITAGIPEASARSVQAGDPSRAGLGIRDALRPDVAEWTVLVTFSQYSFDTDERRVLADTDLDLWTVGFYRAAQRWSIGATVPYAQLDSTDLPGVVHESGVGDIIVNGSWAPGFWGNGDIGSPRWTSIDGAVTWPSDDSSPVNHQDYTASAGLSWHWGSTRGGFRYFPPWRVTLGGNLTYVSEDPNHSYWTAQATYERTIEWFTVSAGLAGYFQWRGEHGDGRDASQQVDATAAVTFHDVHLRASRRDAGWFASLGFRTGLGNDGLRDDLTYFANAGYHFQE